MGIIRIETHVFYDDGSHDVTVVHDEPQQAPTVPQMARGNVEEAFPHASSMQIDAVIEAAWANGVKIADQGRPDVSPGEGVYGVPSLEHFAGLVAVGGFTEAEIAYAHASLIAQGYGVG